MCVLLVYLPGDSDKRHLLAAAVVDQRHAHVLYGQDDFLFGQLRLLAVAQQFVDTPLLSEQHNTLETFESTIKPNQNDLTLRLPSWGRFCFSSFPSQGGQRSAEVTAL